MDPQRPAPLPARPDLDHLRGQAKALLAQLKQGDAAAARAFLEHLPAARGMTREALRTAKFRLADAQAVVARGRGFASWTVLVRHVEQLRGLEGEWRIARLEIDGNPLPATALDHTRILIDGDRFRTESPEGNDEGTIAIDYLDLRAKQRGTITYGILEWIGDDVRFLMAAAGAPHPTDFTPGKGTLSRWRRR